MLAALLSEGVAYYGVDSDYSYSYYGGYCYSYYCVRRKERRGVGEGGLGKRDVTLEAYGAVLIVALTFSVVQL